MHYQPKFLINKLRVVFFLFFLFFAIPLSAQYSISGTPANPTLNSSGSATGFYSIVSNGSASGTITNVSWSVNPSSSASINPATTTQASITFTNAIEYIVKATVTNSFNQTFTTPDFQVIVSNPPPVTPTDPSVLSRNCGAVTLTVSHSSKPTNVRWYWQGKNSNSFDTTKGFGTTFSATESSGTYTYYLRARNTSTNVWSNSSSSVSVTINGSTARPSATANNEIICSGTSTFITASGVSNATYRWYDANDNYLNFEGATYGTGNLTSNKTYKVSATVNDCESLKRSVTITVNSVPIKYDLTGPSAICSNTTGTVNLSDSQIGTNYQLYKDNSPSGSSFIGTGSSLLWNGITAGSAYKVIATNDEGNCNNVEMNNVVNVGATSPSTLDISVGGGSINGICPGTSITLIATNGKNGTHAWNTGDNTSTISVTPPAGVSTTYTVTADNNCDISQTKSVTLTVLPILGNVSINSGETSRCSGSGISNYSAIASNATFYNWEIGPSNVGNTINASTGEVQWSSTYSGTTTIFVTAGDGCQTKSTSISVVVSSQITYYLDEDRDGYSAGEITGCTNPDPLRYVNANDITGANDCVDTDTTINPETIWFLNADGDSSAAIGGSFVGCNPPNTTDYTKISLPETDCDDTDSAVQNRIWYLDADGDGHSVSSQDSCDSPGANYVLSVISTNDCDDTIFDTSNSCNSGGGNSPAITFTGDNYVYTRTYQDTVSTIPNTKFKTDATANKYIQDITYFDGLGRPIQQIGIRQSPNKQDIVTHMVYDDYGRMEKEWLPYEETLQTIGQFKTGDIESNIQTYYGIHYGDDFDALINPYSEKQFESSPLNRIEKQAAPGKEWKLGSDHEIEFAYQTNMENEVKRFDVTLTFADNMYTPTIEVKPNYLEGELFKSVIKDENHISADGKNHTTEEFTDKQGRVVLKRTYADVTNTDDSVSVAEPHDTYYVYDDYGNLTYVLPPKMNGDPTFMNELGYQYVYDYRNRLVEKRIPGKGKEYIIYNRLDQPIMTQDANQRVNNEWLFTKYDAFDRVTYTGIYSHGSNISRIAMQSEVTNHFYDSNGDRNTILMYEERDNANTSNHYYSNSTFPTSNLEVLTVNYYDSYVSGLNTAPTTFTPLGETSSIAANTIETQGLATGSKVKVLDQNPEKWINTITYYDAKGRPIYTYSENDYLTTIDIVETELDFIGKPVKTRSTHTRETTTIVTIDNFTFDHAGRLLAQTQCIGDETMGTSCGTGEIIDANIQPDIDINGPISAEQTASNGITVTNATLSPGAHLYITNNIDVGDQELIIFNEYDNLGQLEFKKVGGTPNFADFNTSEELQKVDYTYNVRGWLKTINKLNEIENDLFAFSIGYTEGDTPLYNGNIAQTQWKTANSDPSLKSYNYDYDPLNRITSAIDDTSDNRYSLTHIEYDKNGNIQKLKRNGHTNNGATSFGVMDDLTYSYTGNQLKAVDDDIASSATQGFVDGAELATEYTYDGNGNVLTDANKGIIDMEYNHYDLPILADFGGGNKIEYIYDALGNKLKKKVTDLTNGNKESDYIGNHVYENGSLKFFTHAEGYVQAEGNGDFSYVYQYKDHLGNVRLSYSDNNNDGSVDSSEIIEEKNYYPFGLIQKGYNFNINGIQNNYLTYNGKEFDMSLNMNMYDLGARMMDPALGRFMNIDPMTVFVDYQSPYVVADNNPIGNVDEYGLGRKKPCKCDKRNIFKKIGDFFKKLFGPKKQKRKSGKGTPPKNTGRGKPQRRAKTTTTQVVSVGSFDLPTPNIDIPLPEPQIASIPEFDGRLVVPDNPVTFEREIGFKGNSDKFKDINITEKALNDLIKTLKEHTYLKVLILGNTSANIGGRARNLSSDARINGQDTTVGGLQLARARAVERFLISRGISWRRISVGNGEIRYVGPVGRTTSFKVSDPGN